MAGLLVLAILVFLVCRPQAVLWLFVLYLYLRFGRQWLERARTARYFRGVNRL
jgi:hypothetical protein